MSRRLRAEWEPQSAVLIAWPHPGSDWASDLDVVEPVYDRLTLEISQRQPVMVLANDDAMAEHVWQRLDNTAVDRNRVCVHTIRYEDTWTRDYGPLGVDDGSTPALLDYRFNGWGGKYDSRLDDQVSDGLHSAAAYADTEYHHLPWVMEGGAIETDGHHTLMATTRSVVSDTRNPGASKTDIETMLESQLGIRRFLWLEHGTLQGDDTDGHIDMLARFADPATILHITADQRDPDGLELIEMANELAAMHDAEGKPYRLVPLPPAGHHFDGDGRRLPASYANFLILNDAVLIPVYGVDRDHEAVEILRSCFPGRTVVPIDCRALIRQNGSLHCATMQLPPGAFRCPKPEQ